MAPSQLSVFFFLQAAVIVGACHLVGRLARRLGQPQVVGEILAGVMLGPSLFGLLLPQWQQALFPKDTMGVLYVVGQLGIGLYMFLVGLEFRSDLAMRHARSAAAVSFAGIVVPFALAFALTPWLHTVPGLFPLRTGATEAALFLGAATAVTAFPVLARIIEDRGIAGTPLGVLALTAGACDDVVAWCALAVVLAAFGGSWTGAYAAVAGAAAFSLVLLSVGRRLLRGLERGLPAGAALPGARLAAVLVLFALCAFAMDAIGIHAVFGGFLLGCAMPRGALARRLDDALRPIVAVFLLPMFFAYSGLNTQFGLLLEPGLMAAAAVILLASFCGKAVACWAAARLAGERPYDAMAIGTLMNARGLMELVMVNIGLAVGIIDTGLFSILVLMAVVTTLVATPLFDTLLSRRERQTLRSDRELSAPSV